MSKFKVGDYFVHVDGDGIEIGKITEIRLRKNMPRQYCYKRIYSKNFTFRLEPSPNPIGDGSPYHSKCKLIDKEDIVGYKL